MPSDEYNEPRPPKQTIPRLILADILRNSSPEMSDIVDEITNDLHVLEALNVGILAARARDASVNAHIEDYQEKTYVSQVVKIVRDEMTKISTRLDRIVNAAPSSELTGPKGSTIKSSRGSSEGA